MRRSIWVFRSILFGSRKKFFSWKNKSPEKVLKYRESPVIKSRFSRILLGMQINLYAFSFDIFIFSCIIVNTSTVHDHFLSSFFLSLCFNQRYMMIEYFMSTLMKNRTIRTGEATRSSSVLVDHLSLIRMCFISQSGY